MESQTTQPQNMNLDYAPASPKRRKWLRRGIVLAIILACTGAAWRWGPAAWRQGRIRYWQHECIAYTAGPDVVAYEDDPVAAAKLLASKKDYVAETVYYFRHVNEAPDRITCAVLQPECIQHFETMTGLGPLFNGVDWNRSRLAVAFLHELSTPTGHRYLVSIRIDPRQSPYEVPSLSFTTTTIPLAPTNGPIRGQSGGTVLGQQASRDRRPIRVYMGQPDPDDRSHFTIRYQLGDLEGVLDGYLRDNQGVDKLVTIEPRKKPEALMPR
jgi:hypothetical protein